MRRNKFLIWSCAVVCLGVFAGCGGGTEEETPAATAARGAAPTSTVASSPQATTSAGSTPVTQQPRNDALAGFRGTVIEKAVQAGYELENVKYGGRFVWPTQFSNALDPKLNNSGIGGDVRPNYEKIVNWATVGNDEFHQITPQLAEKWEANKELTVYTFNLRKGVKWHNVPPVNGRELVANDIVFSMNRYREPDAVNYASYKQIVSIETPDQYTVVIKIDEPNAFLLSDLIAALDYIVPREIVQDGSIVKTAIGTGPYIMTRWDFRQGSSHVRNPNYWGKDAKGNQLPYIDGWEVPFITDNATSLAAFRSGQIDVPIRSAIDDVIQIGKSTNIRVFGPSTPSAGQGLTFRTTKAPWNDIRVRAAFNMALDKEKFGDTVEGIGRWVYHGPLPAPHVFDRDITIDDLGPYAKFNPEKAKQFLIEAGYKDGKIKVPTALAAAQGLPYGPRTATFQALWKPYGIEIELEAMDFAKYNPYYFTRAIPDIALTHHILAQPNNLYWYALNKWHPDAVQNTAWINDAKVNEVIRQLKVTTDPAKKREFAKFLWDFDTLNSYTVWTPVAPGFTMTSARVRNYYLRQGGTGFMPLVWLTDAPRTSP